jgi:hypothetical protein
MSVICPDTEFAPSRVAEHYTPARRPSQRGNVIACVALACVIGIALAGCFLLGWSGGFRP